MCCCCFVPAEFTNHNLVQLPVTPNKWDRGAVHTVDRLEKDMNITEIWSTILSLLYKLQCK